MRICSLLPGATEVVAALGLADELVGISHECDYPQEIRRKPVLVRAAIDTAQATSREIDRRVRETLENGDRLYALDEPLFSRAQPDLVITQDLCQVCAITPSQLQRAIAALPKEPRLLTLNPTGLNDVLADVERIGGATGREPEARTLAATLRARLQSVRERVATAERPTVVCLEWLDPLYAAGHWVPEMVARAGGKDPIGTGSAPSKHIAWEQVLAAAPDVLVMMPCGFSATKALRELDRLAVPSRWPGWATIPAVRNGRVFAVDASSYFSRPGPRLVEGVAMLATLCHPSLFGATLPPGVERMPSGNLRAS
ncbi:MAG: cobalamin-binding protein [Nitrospirae bacterium]|nr:MAG: cobalamin-binding protein [Nitrospirota bacterium]